MCCHGNVTSMMSSSAVRAFRFSGFGFEAKLGGLAGFANTDFAARALEVDGLNTDRVKNKMSRVTQTI